MPRALRFRIVNVFGARGPFTGNPLCVFEDGRGLSTAAMQGLARQFHLSETTFLLPSRRATARVRIFTPEYEMPFAGHPTLGSAAVAAGLRGAKGGVTLEMRAGVVPVGRAGPGAWELRAPAPRWREAPEVDAARLLGLPRRDLRGPVLRVHAGVEQLVVPLASAAAVRRARPDVAAFRALRADGMGQALFFAEGRGGRVEARFAFVQGSALAEDPATGSACANLGGWYLARGVPLPLRRTVHQGAGLERPSILRLHVGADRSVRVAGLVREIGRGTVRV